MPESGPKTHDQREASLLNQEIFVQSNLHIFQCSKQREKNYNFNNSVMKQDFIHANPATTLGALNFQKYREGSVKPLGDLFNFVHSRGGLKRKRAY